MTGSSSHARRILDYVIGLALLIAVWVRVARVRNEIPLVDSLWWIAGIGILGFLVVKAVIDAGAALATRRINEHLAKMQAEKEAQALRDMEGLKRMPADERFFIRGHGRDSLWYQEEDRAALIPCEPGDPWYYYLREIYWVHPHREEALSPQRLAQVQGRVIQWLTAQGFAFETDLDEKSIEGGKS